MIGRLACGICNGGFIGYERNSSVRAVCVVCYGSGWMPYWLQAKFTDAQLLERGLSAESIATFRAAAKLASAP